MRMVGFRGRRARRGADASVTSPDMHDTSASGSGTTPEGERSMAASAATGSNQAAVQVIAHTVIAELFGIGLRTQNIAGRAPDELQQELLDLADQIDKTIREVREFAFKQPSDVRDDQDPTA
jgi:hypothetical protein